VLLCDDVDAFRDLMRVLLVEEPGIEIVGEAGDGRTGIAAAARLEPDVVLLDLSMPDIDGLAAIPMLREQVPDCAIIALSGFGAERMEATVREAGASAYVEKGADVSVIRAAILAAGPRRFVAAA
jgi:DNA-binding NarL/FixJ family response regulator